MSSFSVPLHATLATMGPSPSPNVVLATRAVEPAGSSSDYIHAVRHTL